MQAAIDRAAILDPLSTELADHPVRGGLNDTYTLKLFPGQRRGTATVRHPAGDLEAIINAN
jgi:hypothetical protein